jgi:hypothetical protein
LLQDGGTCGIIISGVSCEEKNPENELLNPCSDLSQLSESDLEARRKFNYLEQRQTKTRHVLNVTCIYPVKKLLNAALAHCSKDR